MKDYDEVNLKDWQKMIGKYGANDLRNLIVVPGIGIGIINRLREMGINNLEQLKNTSDMDLIFKGNYIGFGIIEKIRSYFKIGND